VRFTPALWQKFFSDSNLMGDGKGNLPEADLNEAAGAAADRPFVHASG